MASTYTFPDTSVHEALPSNVTPTHYKIHLFNLDTAKNTFSGVANIHFNVNSTTSRIILHQKFLEFHKTKIIANMTKTQTEIPVHSITKNDAKETVEFSLSKDNTSALAKGSIIYRQSLINDPLGSDLGQLRYTIVFEWANVNHHKLYSRILVRLMIFSYSTFYLLRVVCLSSPDALYCPAVKPTPAQFTMPPVGTAC